MDFETFLSLKKNFLQNLDMVWLITGHLDEKEALKIVECTENSLKFKRISEEDVESSSRCVKLRDRTVYNLENQNLLSNNPNSACKCIW